MWVNRIAGVDHCRMAIDMNDAPPDTTFDEQLKNRVGEVVSKPFLPREIHFVDALPETRSMKTMRRIVRAAFLGEHPGDPSSISNPETIQPNAGTEKG
ncbi:hypothetical protein RM530_16520 [Algiphilus sp. W345]|uniref:AMP-binding enzyme C-terminal domain-containing protein n=1 Tax=Banduia mediterranea TaxID=3075609 RepID=A0ABU2WM51_9GAMM|nr:hypothetical protein [Algiphilus sp. W345]MDT0498950.1 hypothetical protein [Algiphilus sp. W345]